MLLCWLLYLDSIIFKPHIDTRYSKNKIVSHNNNSMDSVIIKKTEDLFDIGNKYDVVGIDEAQFFDSDLIEMCKNLTNKNTRVIVAGLDSDYRGSPFGPMPDIMCESDYLDKLTAICIKCGNPASCTQRITKQLEEFIFQMNNLLVNQLDLDNQINMYELLEKLVWSMDCAREK